jgi:chemotaxis protein CheD
MTDIGERNIAYVRKYIYEENFDLAAEDVGDVYPRKVLYFPDTGAVKVRKLRETINDTVLQREISYSNDLKQKSAPSGGVELFD